MKILLILLTPYLALASISQYPSAETLIYSQIDQILSHENHTDPALVPCLEVANEFVLGGLFVNERKAIVSALFPSPTGKSNWTARELTNAAILIINQLLQTSKITLKTKNALSLKYKVIGHYVTEGLDHEAEMEMERRALAVKSNMLTYSFARCSHQHTQNDDSQTEPLTLEELDNALELYPLPQKVDRSDVFINLHILETLHTVLSEAEEGQFDLKKDTLKLLVPAVDVSMWESADIKKAIEKNFYPPKLLNYLKDTLNAPKQSLDNGKTYCVVTPVGVIPHSDPYYYIPKDTKELIKMAKNNFTLIRDYSTRDYMAPEEFKKVNVIKYH